MKKLLFLLLLPLPFSTIADSYSQEFSQCTERSGGVTTNMLNCISIEYKKQDSRLNQNYKKLLNSLNGQTKNHVQNAQKTWLKHQEATCDLYEQISDGGTAFTLMSQDCYLKEVTERADFLQHLIDLKEQQ